MYYKATTDTSNDRCWGRSTNKPKEKQRRKEEKQMPTTADQQNEDDRRPLHPPKKYHHFPNTLKRRVPSNTFKKEAATTPLLPGLVLGFPPLRGKQWGEGCTQRPSGRSDGTHRRRRIRAGRAARDFSQPKPPPPPQTNHSAPPITPPTNMCHHGHRINFVVAQRSPTRDLEDGRRDSGLGGIRNIADVRGQPPPPL